MEVLVANLPFQISRTAYPGQMPRKRATSRNGQKGKSFLPHSIFIRNAVVVVKSADHSRRLCTPDSWNHKIVDIAVWSEGRSEERRVGKERRYEWGREQ